jgi:protein AaeX
LRFVEIDIFGVYVAPITVLMLAAWAITVALRGLGARLGLMRHVFHPALFTAAVYIIVLSTMVLAIALRSP